MVPAGSDAATTEKLVMENEEVKALITGKTVKKLICVPGRLINIVI